MCGKPGAEVSGSHENQQNGCCGVGAGQLRPALTAHRGQHSGPCGTGAVLPQGPQGGPDVPRRGRGGRPGRRATQARTKRLSNFFASVMWTQLSFSTTLICFTSSLNLCEDTGRSPHGPHGPAPGSNQDRVTGRGPGPGSHSRSRPLPPGPLHPTRAGPGSYRLSVRCPPLACLNSELPAQPAGPQPPDPTPPSSRFQTRTPLLLFSAPGTSPPRSPVAGEASAAWRVGQRSGRAQRPEGSPAQLRHHLLHSLAPHPPLRPARPPLFLTHAKHRPARPWHWLCPLPRCSPSAALTMTSGVLGSQFKHDLIGRTLLTPPPRDHTCPFQLTPNPDKDTTGEKTSRYP